MTQISRYYLTCVIAAFLLIAGWVAISARAGQSQPASPKYVFLFLADGGGIAHLEITRQYNRQVHNQGMVISDKIMTEGSVGLMTTHAANSLSTDSAAAATALASGCKAKIGALGVCADGSVPDTVMEHARRRGMRIGLVTNSTVYDASPAAFVCHVPNRRHFASIIDRYLELEPDVILGGGKEHFVPKSQAGSQRNDEIDAIAAFQKKGYQTVSNKLELERSSGGKLLGLFSAREMSFEIEREKNSEPSVYDMTRAAIRHLHDNNPRGFFAFIENENIDTASHLSDIAAVIHDYRELDRAVAVAYEFYKKYPRETLILVTSDHETGGLGFTEALKDLSSTRSDNRVAATGADLNKLQSITISLQKASRILGPAPTPEAVDKLMRDHFNGFTLAPEFKEAIIARRPPSRTMYIDPTAHALGLMIANNTQAYWQTSSHTNNPVAVAALGVGSEHFRGYYDNADFGKKLLALLDNSRTLLRQ
ncbi:MAG TPA: alkaline phosphatase [Candidatus Polarisedimenticolaceae bacterium]|nr:alkaline phosphatase [Candidatus Polarisedimenticolaceae bacterium]